MRGEDDMPQNPHKGNIYCNVRRLLVVVKEENPIKTMNMAKITPIKTASSIQISNGIVFGYGSETCSPKITVKTRD